MLEHPVIYVYQAGGHMSNSRHCVGRWLREEAQLKVSVGPAIGSMYVGRYVVTHMTLRSFKWNGGTHLHSEGHMGSVCRYTVHPDL